MSFKKVLRKIYHWIISFLIQKKEDYKRRKKWYKLSKIVENYYKGKDNPPEIKKSLSFLHKNHFNLNEIRFLYLSKITDKYIKKYATLPVYHNNTYDLPYIYHEGKPLYFPKGMDAGQIRVSYAMFLSEMDRKSPHLYCKDPHELQGRILFDCGVAEGLFPLTYIDSFKKIVLFECDPTWIEALKATFSPYMDKVSIVNQYVSDMVSENTTTLDHYAETKNIQPDFIKMDIEGYEEKAIKGAINILSSKRNIICAICTYHTPDAEANITQMMISLDYKPQYNHGHMIFHYEDTFSAPYLRRGVVRFYKNQ